MPGSESLPIEQRLADKAGAWGCLEIARTGETCGCYGNGWSVSAEGSRRGRRNDASFGSQQRQALQSAWEWPPRADQNLEALSTFPLWAKADMCNAPRHVCFGNVSELQQSRRFAMAIAFACSTPVKRRLIVSDGGPPVRSKAFAVHQMG